jgi:thiol-disulfide isomerase/thioredoxin
MRAKIHKIFQWLIFILIASNAFAWRASAQSELPMPPGIIALDGRNAPALKLKNMDGEAFDLANAKGHWVFVHFWASWCGPCRKEMPTIQTIATQLPANKLKIILVNTAESDDTVFSFIGIVAPDLTPLLDYDGVVTEAWQPRGLPSTYLVDPQGKLRFLALGGRPWDKPEYVKFLSGLINQ